MARVVVVGATGFIGSAVAQALHQQGHVVVTLRAPRLALEDGVKVTQALQRHRQIADTIVVEVAEADAVINAAGNPDASQRNDGLLIPPNAVLPGLIAMAVEQADIGRLVHVSSAVVQGRKPQLDQDSATCPFSAYSRSKALGEQLVLSHALGRAVVYRPPSVHAVDRRVTRAIGKISRSPFATVARPGNSPSPQALVDNVASAIVYLATTTQSPPPIVSHPAEGVTTGGLMCALGGRSPRQLPRWLARAGVGGLTLGGRAYPGLAANARRLEMLWFGQQQGISWLTEAGWVPPEGVDAWREMGRQIASPGSGQG